jgi:serine/threonine protein kinase
MPTPPDPNGRSRPANNPAGAADASGQPADGRASTGSHRTTPPGASEPSLSDLLRAGSGSSRKAPSASEIASRLAPVAPGPPPNTDDAPTVITNSGNLPLAPPPPPYVVGEMPSVAGRRLGHFELIEAVGAGGMAAVLRARDLELGRIVALKILPPEAARDPENVTRFKQEARAAAKLDHENVARVYFCGEDQGLHFIAFEFVEGITLRQMIDRRGTVPAAECVRYMIQVAAGLAHAAERQVVHRDIKPSNIIITPDGRAKIVDMGLARHLDSASVNGGVTQSGVTLGTFDYISPEQALDPRRADVRSDIYSLGCAFYHALTGRPPVPEGTAAKKLHAHQHLWPLDPRELNPLIPDEVAAVLARMMAKDPDRRYQTPAELIAHLKGVAERLRLPIDAVASDSAVQAVLADPNVLPAPPRLPLGWVLAAAGVAVAIAALIIATADHGPNPNAPEHAGPTLGKGTPPVMNPPVKPNGTGAPPATAEHGVTVHNEKELVEALAKPDTTKVVLIAERYDLTKHGKITFAGKHVEIAGQVVDRPPRVIFTAGSLTLKAETVTLTGIRFEVVPVVEADVFGFSLQSPAAGLLIPDAARVTLTDCTFTPEVVRKGTATVAVGRTGDAPAEVSVNRCVFAPGSIGLRVPARCKLAITDSGFGPHAAAVRIDRGEPNVRAAVELERSSFMLDPGSAAVDAEGSAADVTATYCVFAATGLPGDGSGRKGVVLRADEDFERVKLATATGKRNAYYGVDPLGAPNRTFTFEDCRTQKYPADETGWTKLRERPWDADRGGVLAPFATPDPYRAFTLRLSNPDVFIEENRTVHLFGAQFHRDNVRLAYLAIRVWPPIAPQRGPADYPEKYWEPNAANEDLPPGHYKRLSKLLDDARSGDTILIVGNGPIPVPKVELQAPTADRGEFKLTFKPAPGSHPVLVCSPQNNDRDAALFRLVGGEVEFQDLHFRLRPGERDSVAAVNVLGGRKCTFTRCAFTLEEENEKAAAAVSVSDPGRKMVMMTPAAGRPVPEVEFHQCFVRGRGRGVWVPDGQVFKLTVENSLTAVFGPVVLLQGAGKDVAAANRSAVRLTRSTCVLGGPLIELFGGRAGEMRGNGLAPVEVTADGCLFAAAPLAGRSLVELNGVNPEEVKPKSDASPLTWKTEKGNRYANFEPTVAAMVARPGGGGGEKAWEWDEWVAAFAGEPAERGPVGKVTFKVDPAAVQDLAAVRPGDLELQTVTFPDLSDPAKADVGARLSDVARPFDDEEE